MTDEQIPYAGTLTYRKVNCVAVHIEIPQGELTQQLFVGYIAMTRYGQFNVLPVQVLVEPSDSAGNLPLFWQQQDAAEELERRFHAYWDAHPELREQMATTT